MLHSIDPDYPESHLVHQVVRELEAGEVVIIPTDTVYALACDLHSRKAIQRLSKIKGGKRKKLFSIILSDLAEMGIYTDDVSSFAYRTMRRLLPGPYTFVVQASREIPKLMHANRRTIGIRVPDCPITLAIANQLGRPLVATTLGIGEEEFLSNPWELDEEYGDQVALVVEGGVIYSEPSSVVDLTGPEPEILRAGKGDLSAFGG